MIGGISIAAIACEAADSDIPAASKAAAANVYHHLLSHMITYGDV